MSYIEALYIFDEHNVPILEHVWHGRPPSAKEILPFYLAVQNPRPSVIYLTETISPCVLYSNLQDRLLFMSPSSSEIDPLLVLEFLQRVGDALEEILGSPLVASKIESSYDVVAQLLGEMCDAGLVDKTEPNALSDLVQTSSRMSKLLDSVGLPGAPPTFATSNSSSLSSNALRKQDTPTIPWRRSNVYHTSNELYVDMVETMHVISAPSGRLLSARAHGSIAMNCRVSGVPDLLLQLGGLSNMNNIITLPVFHPCVRLAHWSERPGELSFVPPDGRFVLAGYEIDLLDKDHLSQSISNTKYRPNLRLPVSLEMKTALGHSASDFEVKLLIDKSFTLSTGRGGARGPSSTSFATRSTNGTSAAPALEEVLVTIPIPSDVRNITEMKASKGEAAYSPGDRAIEWRISNREILATTMAPLTLRCTVAGQHLDDDTDAAIQYTAPRSGKWEYDDAETFTPPVESGNGQASEERNARLTKRNALLMPTGAALSFSIRGWLASGIKVQKLVIDARKSRGLGRGVEPTKGVKYLTVSRKGVEIRC